MTSRVFQPALDPFEIFIALVGSLGISNVELSGFSSLLFVVVLSELSKMS